MCGWSVDLTAVGRPAGAGAGLMPIRAGVGRFTAMPDIMAGVGRFTPMPDKVGVGVGRSTAMPDITAGAGRTHIGASIGRSMLSLEVRTSVMPAGAAGAIGDRAARQSRATTILIKQMT